MATKKIKLTGKNEEGTETAVLVDVIDDKLATVSTVGGAVVSPANPVPVENIVGGAEVTSINPLPIDNVDNEYAAGAQKVAIYDEAGAAFDATNPVPSETIVSGVKVSSTNPLPTGVYDANGNPIGSNNGALDVHVADVHTDMVNEHLRQDEGTTDTLSVAGSVGDYSITVVDGTQFILDDRIVLSEGSLRETATIKIISVATNVLNIDKPLENNYTTAAIVKTVIKSMNVNGSVTRQIFSITPPPDELWHIYRMTIAMVHAGAPSDDKFGDLAKLTRGLVLRHSNGITNNLSVWRDNTDIVEDTGVDLRYSSKAGGGLYGTAARWTFKRAGTVLHLDGSLGDTFSGIVQDALQTLGDLEIKIQGHVEHI